MLNSYVREDEVLLVVGCIIFGLKYFWLKGWGEPEKGKSSLTGGFREKNEDLGHAAICVLNRFTGLD